MNINAELGAFNDLKNKTEDAAGQILWIEFKMRYLAERSQEVVYELEKVMEKKKVKNIIKYDGKLDNLLKEIEVAFKGTLKKEDIDTLRDTLRKFQSKNTKKKDKNCKYYWNCDLDDLLKAIKKAFKDTLSKEDIGTLKKFQEVRNKYLHANFVEALTKLGLSTGGRVIKKGKRVPLEKREIGESIKAFHSNKGIRAVRKLTSSAEDVLKNLLIQT